MFGPPSASLMKRIFTEFCPPLLLPFFSKFNAFLFNLMNFDILEREYRKTTNDTQ